MLSSLLYFFLQKLNAMKKIIFVLITMVLLFSCNRTESPNPEPTPLKRDSVYIKINKNSKDSIYIFIKRENTKANFIGHVISRDTDLSDKIYQDVYRLSRADEYLLENNKMKKIHNLVVAYGESEVVFMQNNKVDYTGGYHGDEKFTSLKIIADNSLLDISKPLELQLFKKVSIEETSDLFETFNTGELPTSNHPIFAKRNKTLDFTNFNLKIYTKTTFEKNFDGYFYAGIFCFGKVGAQYGISENGEVATFNNSLNQNFLKSYTARKVTYKNDITKLGGSVTSRILSPLNLDSKSYIFVQDRINDAKYYRRTDNFSLTSGNSIETEQTIHYTKNQ